MWRILLGIMYLTAFCEASEYIFSYRVAARDSMLLNEKYYFSPAMVSANILRQTKNPYKKCTISHEAKTEKALLRDYKEKILECFLNWGVRLEDNTQVQNLQGKSITYLMIPPTRIQIEYAEGIATIYALTRDINKTIKAIKE